MHSVKNSRNQNHARSPKGHGLSVIEYQPKNEKAVEEISSLYTEIYGQKGNNNEKIK